MSKETETSDKRENGNDYIADVIEHFSDDLAQDLFDKAVVHIIDLNIRM